MRLLLTSFSKDPSTVKRLSNTRSRHATPTLSLQASKKSSAVSASKHYPILHEDSDETTSLVSEVLPAHAAVNDTERPSQPLQEVSPNLSPRKTSRSPKQSKEDVSSKSEAPTKTAPHTESPSRPASPPKSPSKASTNTETAPAQVLAQNLNADLAELISRKTTSRPNSTSGRSPEKRKKRPLGRAPSGISNPSNSGNLSPALATEEPEASEADGFNTTKETPLPPSTQLGYETPEAEAHRLQMSKKMGTKLQDDHGLTRLASVGTVKDTTITSQSNVSGKLRVKQKGR